ncbi:hypothetical protein AMTR_s00006p00023520 [Amborella trichopoda]|uniref:RIN4 pathogenic type III effector avirulence factor Avr cleavage site domain-containing protein n=1 Tax=Amborella trichopoda TaxID=13333 RepID=W1P6U1_AMBTC|nr:hypothetical protein AMTR_s00006p00023520 [Amborella trichopoda]
MDKGRPLPKFGEWAVNDAASAEGFTVIFNKGRDEKKTGGNPCGPESPGQDDGAYKHGSFAKSNSVSVSFHRMNSHRVMIDIVLERT